MVWISVLFQGMKEKVDTSINYLGRYLISIYKKKKIIKINRCVNFLPSYPEIILKSKPILSFFIPIKLEITVSQLSPFSSHSHTMTPSPGICPV